MTMRGSRPERYDAAAILLHWVIGLGIASLIIIGLAMVHLPMNIGLKFELYQLHKSIGITVLLAALLRIIWRLTHKPPELPSAMPGLEKKAASASHFLLYALMLTVPLTGWAMVSVSPYNIPTVLYGVIPWPDMPILSGLADKKTADAATTFLHHKLGYIFIALIGLHMAAALRHHFWLRDRILRRMLPFIR